MMLDDIAKEAWRPEIEGWSEDILPYYQRVATELPRGARVVEVGVAHGRSAIYLAEQLASLGRHDVAIYCVDAWEGDWFHRSIVPTLARPELSAFVDKLRILRVDCVSAARLFEDRSLDFIFIDSDHSFESMRAQLRVWSPKVKDGGIIAGHDYSEADWPGVVKAVREFYNVNFIGRPTRTVWEMKYPGGSRR